VVSFTSRPLYSRCKSPRYPLDKKFGGPQKLSRRGGEEENSNHCPCRESNNSYPARSLAIIIIIIIIIAATAATYHTFSSRYFKCYILQFCAYCKTNWSSNI